MDLEKSIVKVPASDKTITGFQKKKKAFILDRIPYISKFYLNNQ